MYFKINYSCGCGDNEEYIIANSLDEAELAAYQAAIDEYDSYEGLHGVRSMQDIATEDFDIELDEADEMTYNDIEIAYIEEKEDTISYNAEEITEKEYKEYMED
jgi:hypothetical protein